MSAVETVTAWAQGLRRSSRLVNHVWSAAEHYADEQGSLLAAAVTYYGFLSIFPLFALAFGTVGIVARVFPDAESDLDQALQQILPGMVGNGPHQLSFDTLEGTATASAGIGLVVVLYSGVSWISDLREGLMAIFRIPKQDQPGMVAGYARALVSLVELGLILLASLGLSATLATLSAHLPQQHATVRALLAALSVAIGAAVSSVFFFTLFRRVTADLVPARSLWSGAALGAVLFEILKQLSGRLLASTSNQPAFQAFGISLILLVWIYYFSRIVMFAASWAYTARPVPTPVSAT